MAECARSVGLLADGGHELLLTHGNGPQVGDLLLQNELASASVKPLPLNELVAMTQAQIGHLLQGAIQAELQRRGNPRPVTTMLAHVLVDPDDAAFRNPTKPIGPFYTFRAGLRLRRKFGWSMVRDPKRGYRRAVPSPKPLGILEVATLRQRLDSDPDGILITCGGGGIPIARDPEGYHGVEAVVDKDLASAILARELNADFLLILSNVDSVFLHYGKVDQEPLGVVSVAALRRHLEEGEFAPGSMGPKVEACVEFVSSQRKPAIITSLGNAHSALEGKSGTRVVPD